MATKNLAVNFVHYIISQICDGGEGISIVLSEDEKGNLITITAPDEFIGKIIGKKGQTISSLRTLLSIISAREEKRYSLKVENNQ